MLLIEVSRDGCLPWSSARALLPRSAALDGLAFECAALCRITLLLERNSSSPALVPPHPTAGQVGPELFSKLERIRALSDSAAQLARNHDAEASM